MLTLLMPAHAPGASYKCLHIWVPPQATAGKRWLQVCEHVLLKRATRCLLEKLAVLHWIKYMSPENVLDASTTFSHDRAVTDLYIPGFNEDVCPNGAESGVPGLQLPDLAIDVIADLVQCQLSSDHSRALRLRTWRLRQEALSMHFRTWK